jgi:V8-like Glu-specific endopeptidase
MIGMAIITGALLTGPAQAQPVAAASEPRAFQALSNATRQSAGWTGIGRLVRQDGSACTATLIDPFPAGLAVDTPAYVLTAGHCVTDAHGAIEVDVAFAGTLTFNYFVDTTASQVIAEVTRLRWASRQGVDLAILELDTPLAQLRAAGVTPLKLAKVHGAAPFARVIGAPAQAYLLGATCQVRSVAAVIEQPWLLRDALSTDCLGMLPGQSGSPMIDPETATVIAVIGTTTHGSQAQWRCQRDTPCESESHQPVWIADTNYASRVDHLSACFQDGRLDLGLLHCPLLPGFALDVPDWTPAHSRIRLESDAQGLPVAPSWNLAFSLDKPRYRFKPAEYARQCEDPVGYSHTIDSTDAYIDTPIGTRLGLHYLCILGVDNAEQVSSRGLMRNAFSHATELFPAGPTPLPAPTLLRTEAGYDVTWSIDPPLITRHRVKHGPVAEVPGCDESGEWTSVWYRRTFSYAADTLPVRLCAYAFDGNGQASPLQEIVLPAPPA